MKAIAPQYAKSVFLLATTTATAASIDTSGANAIMVSNGALVLAHYKLGASASTATQSDPGVGLGNIIVTIPNDGSVVAVDAVSASGSAQLSFTPCLIANP